MSFSNVNGFWNQLYLTYYLALYFARFFESINEKELTSQKIFDSINRSSILNVTYQKKINCFFILPPP